MDYQEFIESKSLTQHFVGLDVQPERINPKLYPFQRDITAWALRKGRAAIFAGTGLGKTFMHLEWARIVCEDTGQPVLIVAPLAVAYQTIQEAHKLGITVTYAPDDSVITTPAIYITNYERIDKFDPAKIGAVVLDESSILKNISGIQRTKLIRMFANTPYRLCTTATPAPNDINELGNHAEFLGYMTIRNMSAVFFVHDSKMGVEHAGSKWRLKKHARTEFFKWLASWSIAINFPSDLGYSDDGFVLPKLTIRHEQIPYDYTPDGVLPGFGYTAAISAIDARKIRRQTVRQRNELIAAMVNGNSEQWLIWCGLNDEANDLATRIPGSRNVEGALSAEEKAQAMIDFQAGAIRVLITKIKIAGMGMNLQNSHNMVFDGLDYSWEGYYQAIRRQWRHGQQHPVTVTIVTSTHENSIYNIVMAKEREATEMTQQLITATKTYSEEELRGIYARRDEYQTKEVHRANWTMWLGDSAERMREIATDSVDLSVYSPPFGTEIFVYSNSVRDLSNNTNHADFWRHYGFIIAENLRIQKPGTVCAVHITDERVYKNQHGYIGIRDFSGDCIAEYIRHGWEFSGRVTIFKDPQNQAIRLNMQSLQFIQMRRDARKLRPAMPDYLLLFRKPGECANPVASFDRGEIDEETWIRWASPVWMDIRETNVLNTRVAKEKDDEKHMCPLQLDFIERCIKLWSNPGELVFDPFAGIGSTGYEAIRWGRQFLGIELKPAYFKVACRNLRNAESANGMTLFDWAAQQQQTEIESELALLPEE